MEPQQPNLDELISGLLDGELTNAEARRLDAEMKANPALQQRMDELAAMRSSLLSGRPSGRLPKNFAARVTYLAKERASEMGEDSPEWLQDHAENDALRSSSRPIATPDYKTRWWIPVASICAAVCIGGLILVLPNPQPQPIASLPPLEEVVSDHHSDGQTVSAEELLQGSIPDSKANLAQTNTPKSEQPEIALQPPTENSADKVVVSGIPSMEIDVPNVRNDQDLAKDVEPSQFDASPKIEGNSIPRTAKARAKVRAPEGFFMLMAVEVDMDKVAVENKALDQIFAKHDIASIEDLAINDEQLQSLLDSGLAGSVSGEGNSIILLKGTGKSLDSAVLEMYRQHKDFPAIGINILFGEEAKILERQFSTVAVSSTAVAKRVIVKNSSGVSSRFSTGLRQAKKLPNAGGEVKPLTYSGNEEALLLLLIREVE